MKQRTYKFIATFAVNHKLGRNFVTVEAKTETEAREKMYAQYGACWAFMYADKRKAGVSDFRLKEVPFGTPNERL